MKIAALQMVSGSSLEHNLATADRLIAQAAAAGAALVALPEYFCFMGRRDADKLALAEPLDPPGPIQQGLAAAARRHGLWLIGGTLPLSTHDPARVRNSTLVFDPAGERVARYDKIHLFRYQSTGEQGAESYDESRVLQAGDTPVAFDALLPGGSRLRIGLAVCYDLRFPELFRTLMQPPCDLLVVPSAFTHGTGRAHWELLLRARAVENQCYVLAPAQGGMHDNGRRTWGHSLAVDPWGEVLAQREEAGEGVVLAELDMARLAEVRRQLPALQHRRL